MVDTVQRIVSEAREVAPGLRGQVKVFFAGVEPRVMWISIGGFIFFGAYEQSIRLFQSLL